MKTIKKYFPLLIILLIINGCDKPAPTQLVQDEDFLEVELISKDAEDDISAGYDSTGFIYSPPGRFFNIITVSGIKTKYNNISFSNSYAQAIFFDRALPVKIGNRLIGYRTRILGNVDFNNVRAKLRPFNIRFKRPNGNNSDTTLGFKHVLHSRPGNPDEDFNFEYNSTINFDFAPFIGNPVQLNISTPAEINGSAKIERNGNMLSGNLTWNAGNSDKFEVIIGASKRGQNDNIFPIYRLRTNDDGQLNIPPELISKIPLNRFDRLVFSLIRKNDMIINSGTNDLYILSQSIHNLIVDIP